MFSGFIKLSFSGFIKLSFSGFIKQCFSGFIKQCFSEFIKQCFSEFIKQCFCVEDSDCPDPPEGHKWKKVQHDNAVTWLASWTENIQVNTGQ